MKTSSNLAFHHLIPTEIVFGPGCLRELGPRCQNLGRKALLVTGRHFARAAGVLDDALAQLPGAIVFDEVVENPTDGICDRAGLICRQEGCDFVVGIGGGSAMDVAKAAAGLARNPGPCRQYFGSEKFEQEVLPIVAVPTTAGTGSEVTPYSVVVDSAERVKRTLTARGLFPAVALLDPNLSLTMPRHVTVSTGLDALSQAMEGVVSRRCTPLCDLLALEACRIIAQWLPRAVEDGAAHRRVASTARVASTDNIEARSWMLYASMLAGCVIAHTGTTLVHGMGYYFTLEYGLPHGLANGLLLAPSFEFTARYRPDKVAAIATALGADATAAPNEVGATIGRAIHAFLARIGVSPAAKDAGVGSDRLAEFAAQLIADPYRYRNQVGDVTEKDVLRFFQQAHSGALGL